MSKVDTGFFTPFPPEEAKKLYIEIYEGVLDRGHTEAWARLLASSFSGHSEPAADPGEPD